MVRLPAAARMRSSEHDQRPDRHFSAQRRGLRLRDGQMHVLEIVHGCGGDGRWENMFNERYVVQAVVQSRMGAVAAHFAPARSRGTTPIHPDFAPGCAQ